MDLALTLKSNHMVDQGAYANPFANRMVMVAGHMNQHGFATGELHGVQKF